MVLATKFNLTFNTFIKLMIFYPAIYQTFQCLCTVISSYSDSFMKAKKLLAVKMQMNIGFIRLFLSAYQGLRKRDTLMLHLNIIYFIKLDIRCTYRDTFLYSTQRKMQC